jgi:hypothetical protein
MAQLAAGPPRSAADSPHMNPSGTSGDRSQRPSASQAADARYAARATSNGRMIDYAQVTVALQPPPTDFNYELGDVRRQGADASSLVTPSQI